MGERKTTHAYGESPRNSSYNRRNNHSCKVGNNGSTTSNNGQRPSYKRSARVDRPDID